MGMFWKRGTGTGAFCAIISGIFFSWLAEAVYNGCSGVITIGNFEYQTPLKIVGIAATYPDIAAVFGMKLNFFHRVVFVLPLSGLVHIVMSFLTVADKEKGRLNWTDLGGHSSSDLKSLVSLIILSILVFAVLGATMVKGWFIPGVAASIAAVWTFAVFQFHISSHRRLASANSNEGNDDADNGDKTTVPLLADDRFWASLLCSAAVFMHYYYY